MALTVSNQNHWSGVLQLWLTVNCLFAYHTACLQTGVLLCFARAAVHSNNAGMKRSLIT